MKVLVLYDYPPSTGGLATQGDLLYKGGRRQGNQMDELPKPR
jgi:alpha-maltose-1-phosphate synthase